MTTDTDPWGARTLKRIALHRAVPAAEKLHRVEQNLRLADALDIPRVPELVCPAAAQAAAVSINGKYAVIHAAPMFAYKEWTPDGWRAVAADLAKRGLSIVAIGGPGETERRYLENVWRSVCEFHQLEWPQAMKLLELDEALCPRVVPTRSIRRSFAYPAHLVAQRLGGMDPVDEALLAREEPVELEIDHPARVGEVLQDPDGGLWMRGSILSATALGDAADGGAADVGDSGDRLPI